MTIDTSERESMEFDLVIVGGGPAGLAAAIRFKQLANEAGEDLSVVVLEKGGEVGAHILSGVVLDPKALDELLPDWRTRDDRPIRTEVKEDKYLWLGPRGSLQMPNFIQPPLMSNHGMFTGSLANVTRWLGARAEELGVEVYPGFAASEVVYGEKGEVRGVVAGVMGLNEDGEPKDDFQPGMELLGKYVLFAEGARGSLTKQVTARFGLDAKSEPQKFGIGLKEVWSVPREKARPGYVQHTFGWPVDGADGTGGGFLYHFEDQGEAFVSVGYVVHLNYKNPYIAPYEEFQRYKHHDDIRPHLEGGKRVAYGARAITSGGLQSVPQLYFAGGALIGCCAGFVNLPRIKGTHNAMKTGMLAAESAFAAIRAGRQGDELSEYDEAYRASWVYTDLSRVRNVKPLMSRFGTFGGAALGVPDMWLRSFLGFGFPTLKHGKADHETLKPAKKFKPIDYPKPDGVISFDKLTSVSFTNTYHAENQPCHLVVLDPAVQKKSELGVYDGPSNRYCPAGVYEWVEETNGEKRFQINSQNCIHCKTCDIKDPNQNIVWTTPEGGGGPAYPNT